MWKELRNLFETWPGNSQSHTYQCTNPGNQRALSCSVTLQSLSLFHANPISFKSLTLPKSPREWSSWWNVCLLKIITTTTTTNAITYWALALFQACFHILHVSFHFTSPTTSQLDEEVQVRNLRYKEVRWLAWGPMCICGEWWYQAPNWGRCQLHVFSDIQDHYSFLSFFSLFVPFCYFDPSASTSGSLFCFFPK